MQRGRTAGAQTALTAPCLWGLSSPGPSPGLAQHLCFRPVSRTAAAKELEQRQGVETWAHRAVTGMETGSSILFKRRTERGAVLELSIQC